jgi:glycosyltransferase involved in cell wall biosynthesis
VNRAASSPPPPLVTASPGDGRGPGPGWPPVIHVTPYYPPHLGGMENTVQIIAESFAATRRVEVLTSTCGAAGQPRVQRSGQLTVRRLRGPEIAHTPVAPALISTLLRRHRDCIVHLHVAQALTPEIVWATSRLRRRAYVAHFHLDVDPSGRAGRWLPLYKRVLLGRALRAASCVIVPSASQVDFVVERYRVPRERVIFVPNGVRRLGAGPAAGARPWAPPLRVLFVGRLAPQKNIPLLIEALGRMAQPAELVVAGDGPELSELLGLVARLGLRNVRLVGRQEPAGLSTWYRWADVFVLSSHKESMPLAVLEAMSFGLPVVATDVPGLRELCSGAGLLVPPDPAALASALDALAADPAARQRLAAQSLARADASGWEGSLEQIEQLYRGVTR